MNRFEESSRAERRREFRARIERHHGSGHIWTGVLLLVIGVAALMRSYVETFPVWVFTWQMLLITMGLFIGLRHKFRGAAWFVLLLIGGVFLVNDYLIEGDLRKNIWPVILIGVGAFFIFRALRKPATPNRNDDDEPVDKLTGEEYSNEDFIDTTAIFGGTKKNILSKNFKGGDIVNVFGGTELNLTQSDIHGVAELELTTIFGGTKLIVPSNWVIKSEAVTIFGGIEDKRSMPTLNAPTGKTLVLKGTVIFGGIDIKSF